MILTPFGIKCEKRWGLGSRGELQCEVDPEAFGIYTVKDISNKKRPPSDMKNEARIKARIVEASIHFINP